MKPWYKSWTIWLNIAIVIVSAIAEVMQLIPTAAAYVVGVTNLLNILLRFKTISAVSLK